MPHVHARSVGACESKARGLVAVVCELVDCLVDAVGRSEHVVDQPELVQKVGGPVPGRSRERRHFEASPVEVGDDAGEQLVVWEAAAGGELAELVF